MSPSSPLICIVGPTASGKSEVADIVAERLSGIVVSVDAMQVYRGMDIGTAKTPPELRRVPLRMVDICDPGDDYSVQRFQADARAAIDEARASGVPCVLCGGTGLYLNAVIDEMTFPAGAKRTPARERYEALAAELGASGLHALLSERDAASAELIHPNNVRRVVRALEMLDEGVSYAKHHAGLHARGSAYDARIFGLRWARETLVARIDRRVDAMFDEGLADEVRALRERGLTRDTTAGQAIGYKEVLDLIDGELSEDEARELVKRRTRAYAKRQMSWFRHDGRVSWIDMDEMNAEDAASYIVMQAERTA